MALLEGIAAVVAKIAGASTVAQVATGVGITVAGVTGAGAAGVLPAPVQDGFAGAVESVTPFDVPDSADDRAGDARSRSADGTHEAERDDARHDGGARPTDLPQVPAPTAPSAAHESETAHHEAEAGDDDPDGIHQHRGGRAEPEVDNSGPGSASSGAGSGRADDDADDDADEDAEVEDQDGHHAGSDDDGSDDGGSDDSGSDDSGSDDGADDHSGHGGGDD